MLEKTLNCTLVSEIKQAIFKFVVLIKTVNKNFEKKLKQIYLRKSEIKKKLALF